MFKVVDSVNVWQVDCILFALGLAFAALGAFVY